MMKTIKPDSKLNLLCGMFRLLNNQCPRCNSDAPAVDKCGVCNNVHHPVLKGTVPNRREDMFYPPNLATKALWLYSWVHPYADRKQEWMEESPRITTPDR